MDISHNEITCEFSECIRNFTRLRLLDISYNQFSGNIPTTISNLTSIEHLFLVENFFEGSFSLSSLANHSKLSHLTLSGSNIGKTQVETEKPRWQPTFQLEVLTLRNCNLNKQYASNIPSFLLSQHRLTSIDLDHNQLVGTFPFWLLHNNTRLELLDLSDNSLTRTLQLPTWKQNLKYFQISGNHCSGQLPNYTGLLPKIEYFNISRNSFEGNLPLSMKQMKNLLLLDVRDNKFSGNLQISMFNKNFRLQCLLFARNNFSGSIDDDEVEDLGNLVILDISNNMIKGKIPSWIGRLSTLQFVQMSKNHFEGELPIEICSLHGLTFLDVSQNQLFGGLPSCFSPSILTSLYMQENFFSGPIPHALSTTNLRVLDLRYNHFSGYIPNWVGNFTSLEVLLLKGNDLEGPIPRQLCQIETINILDLSSNKLTGSIPSCLNNMKFYEANEGIANYFSYHMTRYSSIPDAPIPIPYIDLWEEVVAFLIEQIQVEFTTKLRTERYRGNILLYMSGLDLSSNQLMGNIPQEIGDLVQIHALNFSHNKLVGLIPKVFSNLKQLESLDLSNNLLSGNIPSELAGLNSLGIFNVSYNNLSGMIPTLPQFSSYPESSYYGNAHHCGLYIEHKCSSPILPPTNQSVNLKEEHGVFIDLEAFCWSFAASYIIILLGFIEVLYINPQWRQTWFYFIEDCISYFCKCI